METKPVSILEEDYGFLNKYVAHLKDDRRIDSLWPPQFQSLEGGVLGQNNFLLISKPGSGKTLVAELVMVYEFLEKGNTSVYLVPYKSLAEEKYKDFSKQLGTFGFNVNKSTGSSRRSPNKLFGNSNIVVLTYEKFDYYLRNFPSIVSQIGTVVVDEFHKLNDTDRGPHLEITVSRLLKDHPEVKIVGLSATISNPDEIADWLEAEQTNTGDWQKNEIIEGICYEESNEIVFYGDDKRKESLEKYVDSAKQNAILNFIKGEGNRGLVFASKRRIARNMASAVGEYIEKHPKSYDISQNQEKLDEVSERIKDIPGSQGKNLKTLRKLVKRGVAFHHAGLPPEAKNIIEESYRNGLLKIVVCTPTLAAGVNLPVKRVFILEPRVGSETKGEKISVSMYKNLVGRAGRPQYSNEPGESILFAENEVQAIPLRKRYIDGKIEAVRSQIDLSANSNLLLNLLRDNHTPEELTEFLARTLFGRHKDFEEKLKKIESSIEDLQQMEMLEKVNGNLELTSLGEATSKRLLEPRTVYEIIKYLEKLQKDDIDISSFLAKVISSKEFDPTLRLWLDDYNKSYPKRREVKEELALDRLNLRQTNNLIATVLVLQDWIKGKKVSDIYEEREIDDSYWGTADLRRRIIPAVLRVLRGIEEILKEGADELHQRYSSELKKLRLRIQHGLPEDDIEFAQEGICYNRGLLKHLRKKMGVKKPEDLLKKDIHDVPLRFEKIVDLKKKAIEALLDGFEKELVLLEVAKNDLNENFYRGLINSDQIIFQNRCLSSLRKIDDLFVEETDEEGHTKAPEAKAKIKKREGGYIETDDGDTLEIGIECKTREDLRDPVKTEEAMAVVTKAPACKHKVTIGNPDFEDACIDAAKKNSVLLLDSTSFVELLIQNRKGNLNPNTLQTIFSHRGKLDREEIRHICT